MTMAWRGLHHCLQFTGLRIIPIKNFTSISSLHRSTLSDQLQTRLYVPSTWSQKLSSGGLVPACSLSGPALCTGRQHHHFSGYKWNKSPCQIKSVPSSSLWNSSAHVCSLGGSNAAVGGCWSVRGFKQESKAPGSSDEQTERVLSQLQDNEEVTADSAAWLIRLSNENGYLSWCRNTYIATIAGATIYTQDLLVPFAKESAIILFVMGSLNLLFGTSVFIYNLLHLRHRIRLGVMALVLNIGMAILHLALWFGGMAVYLGYVEEEIEEINKSQIRSV